MRRKGYIVIAVCVLCAAFFTGCRKDDQQKEETDATVQKNLTDETILGGENDGSVLENETGKDGLEAETDMTIQETVTDSSQTSVNEDLQR